MNIITLTLNPAFDLHCEARKLRLYHENFVTLTRREAGGKGVNLSRALLSWGIISRCVLLTGREDHEEFCAFLQRDGLELRAISLPGRIRQNLTFHEEGRPETRISFPGFAASSGVLQQLEQAMGTVDAHTVITFTGSGPEGLESREVKAFLKSCAQKGARLVIDSRLFSLEEMLGLKPFLVKPNEEEAALYGGKTVKSVKEGAAFSRFLYENGAQNAMLSLGGEGALLCCEEGCYHAKAPKIVPLSTVGAGDSVLAGFLAGVKEGLSPDACLRRSVAFGSAACLTEGSQPPGKEDILALEQQVELRRL